MRTFTLAACLIALAALTACGPPTYTETTGKYNLPPELRDCKVYYLGGGTTQDITVVRCPALATTTTSYSVQNGKFRTTHTVTEVE